MAWLSFIELDKAVVHVIRLGSSFQSGHFMANRWRKSGNSGRLYFLGAPKSLQMVIAVMKLKDPYSLEEKL